MYKFNSFIGDKYVLNKEMPHVANLPVRYNNKVIGTLTHLEHGDNGVIAHFILNDEMKTKINAGKFAYFNLEFKEKKGD